MSHFEYEVVRRPGYVALTVRVVSVQLNHEKTISEIENGVAEVLQKSDPQLLVMDLAAVDFWNTDAIAMLLKMYKRIRERDGMMRVCGLSVRLETPYKLCMLDRIIPLNLTVEEALQEHEKEATAHGRTDDA